MDGEDNKEKRREKENQEKKERRKKERKCWKSRNYEQNK